MFDAVEIVLKGIEARLPNYESFKDKDGSVRHEIRTRWFEAPTKDHTYGNYALQFDRIKCKTILEVSVIEEAVPYPATDKPVFVGHYWLSAKRPKVLSGNVACVDYSVAKDGFLCAYRWQSEQTLSNDNFVWVKGSHTCPMRILPTT